MKIIFSNWHDARVAIEGIKVEPFPRCGVLFLCQEGCVRDAPSPGVPNPLTWHGGTGRWFITDQMVPDRCALNWTPRS